MTFYDTLATRAHDPARADAFRALSVSLVDRVRLIDLVRRGELPDAAAATLLALVERDEAKAIATLESRPARCPACHRCASTVAPAISDLPAWEALDAAHADDCAWLADLARPHRPAEPPALDLTDEA